MSFTLFFAMAFSTAQAPTPMPAGSCQSIAGSLTGEGASMPVAVDGTKITSSRALNKVIRDAPYGQPLIIKGGNFSGWSMGLTWRGLFGPKKFLNNVCFVDTKMANTNWLEAQTSGMGFINVDLTDAVMDEAQLPFVLFRNTTLKGVQAKGADFSYGKLDGGWSSSIANWNIEDADLTGFRFVCGSNENNGCPFDRSGIKASRANLTNASVRGFSVLDADFTQARIEGIELGIEQLDQLNGAVALGPVRLHGGPFMQLASAQEFNALRANRNAAVPPDTRCDAPKDPLLIAICSDPSRAMMTLNDDIASLTAGKILDKKLSKKFIKERQKCLKLKGERQLSCLSGELTNWRQTLITNSPAPAWARQAGNIIFARSDLGINKDPVSAALWGRFGTIIIGSAPAFVAAKIDPSGRVSMRGKATGVDKEFCHFNVENLTYSGGVYGLSLAKPDPIVYDKKGRIKPPKKKKLKKGQTQPHLPFIFFNGPAAQLTSNQNNQSVFVDGGVDNTQLVRCNGPVYFGKMEQLQIDSEAFEAIWKSTEGPSF
jgi:uncharacterized protein YjbI with pentapeptide repeats